MKESFFYVNFHDKRALLKDFDKIAEQLSNELALKVNDAMYRIVEFEFYAFSDCFKDPFTHSSEQQKTNGKLYFHRSGVDITFGDKVNYGGILIRGVMKLGNEAKNKNGEASETIFGPLKVMTEVFSNLHELNSGKPNEIALVNITDKSLLEPKIATIKTARFGLSDNKEDNENFKDLALRYIVLLENKKGNDKIRNIEKLLEKEYKENRISQEEVTKIMGYQKNLDK